jgi:hypothetical protein
MSVISNSEGLSNKKKSREDLRQSCSDTDIHILNDSIILDKSSDNVSS